MFQRTESPMCGSPTIFSPACNSMMHTRSGAQTTVGRPAPKEYITRPSGPGDGAFFSPCQRSLTRTASSAVGVSGTSAFGRKSFGTAPLGAAGAANSGFTSAGRLPESSKVRSWPPKSYCCKSGGMVVGVWPCAAGGTRFTPIGGCAGDGDCADNIHRELIVIAMAIRDKSISFLLSELVFQRTFAQLALVI